MKKEKNKMTVKEALNNGYTKCGIEGEQWQTLMNVEEVDFEQDKVIVLAGIEEEQPTITDVDFKELIGDYLNDPDNCGGRDDDEIYDAVEEMDFSKIVDKINFKMKDFGFRMMTDIVLIPNKD